MTLISSDPVYLAPPVMSVDEAIAQMEAIQEYIVNREPRRESDGVACFNYLYTVITKRVRDGINDGFFNDEEFLTILDIEFANRYFDALRASIQSPNLVPRSWDVLIERRSDDRVAELQFAIAGVNAHINLDLSIALVNACAIIGEEPNEGTQRDDYEKVNQIFAEEMQSLRQYYQDHLERTIDEIASPVLDIVGNWSVDAARDAAWLVMEHLWTLRGIGIDLDPWIGRIDRMTAMAGHFLLTPIRY